ncbi:TRAP transporter substrate-binding protein [Magnetococcus sp. PR-3]|uniref:TRAP transporter substrate-binding protein n=1 Tax=Magnetococcus sp. PR-3 TaxID=3120355 RepID=UPI002FCE553D
MSDTKNPSSSPLPRRTFIKGAAATTAVAAMGAPAIVSAKRKIRWKMVTAWPRNFPGLGTGANALAKLITEMSGGRLEVKVFGAGELVQAFEIFDVVSRGTADMGHGAAYYWKGKHPATQFFAAVPFGLTAQEMNAWIYQGGGYQLWEKLYRQFDLIPSVAGNTGTQMGGWFNKEINQVEDLNGLKMRIPGLGGEVLKRAGGTPVNIPGGEIFSALSSGTIDATEWVGPYNDLAFGIYKAAQYYYYPGWHEPGTTIECLISRKSFEALPKDLQSIVQNAIKVANMNMLANFTARNNSALEILVNKHKVDLRPYPKDVLVKLRDLSDEVVAEIAHENPLSKEIYDSYRAFRAQAVAWHSVSEQAYMNARHG